MYRVEYTNDDPITSNPLEKCTLCNHKCVTKTICCDVKLCGFHIRFDGEHADQPYYSCQHCEIMTLHGDDGYILNYDTVYCHTHNTMHYCDRCQEFVCEKHINHECVEPIEVSSPEISPEELDAFINKHMGNS